MQVVASPMVLAAAPTVQMAAVGSAAGSEAVGGEVAVRVTAAAAGV